MQSLPNFGDRLLLLGRVLPRIHSAIAQPTTPASILQRQTPEATVLVRVPVLQFNDFLKRYFKKEHDLLAHDPDSLGQEGDTVLLQRLSKPSQKQVDFQVKEVIQRLGDVRDPTSSDRHPVVADHYRRQLEEVAQCYGRNPDDDRFNYQEAPERGWQLGKRDFTDRVTYYNWHVFKKKDGYSLVS